MIRYIDPETRKSQKYAYDETERDTALFAARVALRNIEQLPMQAQASKQPLYRRLVWVQAELGLTLELPTLLHNTVRFDALPRLIEIDTIFRDADRVSGDTPYSECSDALGFMAHDVMKYAESARAMRTVIPEVKVLGS